MARILILVGVTLLLQACERSQDVRVRIHIEGERERSGSFHSFEQASEWVGRSCESLWHQAQSSGSSPRFHVVASGPGLAGVIESPGFGFESSAGESSRLVQFDETDGKSPKMEGDDLQWHWVESYIKDELMMTSMFGSHNRNPIEKEP